MSEPSIVAAQVIGGHEGAAELILSIRYGNGAERDVVLENDAGVRLIEYCGGSDLSALKGQSWRRVLDILSGEVRNV